MFPIRDTQPSYSRPIVNIIIILINVAVFLHEITLDPYSRNYLIAHYGLVPRHFHFPLPRWPIPTRSRSAASLR